MKIAGHIVRNSKTYMFKDIDGVRYMFCLGKFGEMTKVRYAARKAAAGKIQLDPTLRGVYVDCDGTIRQFAL